MTLEQQRKQGSSKSKQRTIMGLPRIQFKQMGTDELQLFGLLAVVVAALLVACPSVPASLTRA